MEEIPGADEQLIHLLEMNELEKKQEEERGGLDAILSEEELKSIHIALDVRERLLAELVERKGVHGKLRASYERELETVKTATRKIRKAILGIS